MVCVISLSDKIISLHLFNKADSKYSPTNSKQSLLWRTLLFHKHINPAYKTEKLATYPKSRLKFKTSLVNKRKNIIKKTEKVKLKENNLSF